jgi:hypothetical protein
MKYIILNVLLSLAINLFGLPIHNIGKRIKDNYKILISLDNAANSVLIPEINYNLNYEENDQQELIIVTDHELEYLKCYIDELGPEPLILELRMRFRINHFHTSQIDLELSSIFFNCI